MGCRNRTIEEYLKRYANDYCGGDIEVAKTHAIVQEVYKSKEEDRQKKIVRKLCIMQYIDEQGVDTSMQINPRLSYAHI